MSRRSNLKRETFWRELIARRNSTGTSVAEECQRAGVSTAAYYAWQKRLGVERNSRPRTARQANVSTLLPVRIVDDREATAAVIVELPSGIRMLIPPGFDAQTIREVLAALPAARQGDAPC